ncbi:hypothetical protein G3N98_22240, partial [Burkholderia sp. Tr-20390]|nr:hypothetical protein [Burkholderia sp. Tr-20390]
MTTFTPFPPLAQLAAYEQHQTPGAYEPTPEASGRRALKNLALAYLAELEDPADA